MMMMIIKVTMMIKGCDSFDDAEGVSSGYVSSGSDDMSPCAHVNESECRDAYVFDFNESECR